MATDSINFDISVKWDRIALATIQEELNKISVLQEQRRDALNRKDLDAAKRIAQEIATAQSQLDATVYQQRKELLQSNLVDAEQKILNSGKAIANAQLAIDKLEAQRSSEEQLALAKELAEQEKQINSGVAAAKKRSLLEADIEGQRPTPSVTGRGLQTFARSTAAFGLNYEAGIFRQVAAVAKLPEQIQAVTYALGDLGLSAEKVAKIAPIAGVGIGTVLILLDAWQKFQKILDDGNAAVEKATDELYKYYLLIGKATAESLKPSIEEAQAAVDAQKRILDEKKRDRIAADQAVTDANKNQQPLVPLLIAARAAGDTADAAARKYDELTTTLYRLTAAGDEQIVKNRSTLTTNQEQFDKYLDAKKQEREALAMSSEENKKRGKSLADELSDLQTAMDGENAQAAALNLLGDPAHAERMGKLITKFNELTVSARILSDALPAVTFFEQFANSIKSVPGAIKDLTKELDNLKKVAKIQQDIIDLDAQYAEEQAATAKQAYRDKRKAELQDAIDAAKNREKYDDAVRKVNEDSAKRRANLEDKYLADRYKRLQDYLLKEAEALADYNKKRSRFVEDSNETLTELAAKGDVSGFVLAQRRAAKDLARMDEDFKDEQKKRKDAFDLKNKEADEQYAAELAAQIAEDAAKLKQLKDEANHRQTESERLTKQLQDLERQWALDDIADKERIQKQHYLQQKADLTAALIDQQNINSLYWTGVTNTATNALKQLQLIAQNYTAAIGALAPGNIGNAGYSGSGYGYGGYNSGGGGGGYGGGLQSNLSVGDIHIGAGNNVTKRDVEVALQEFAGVIVHHINGGGQ